jgi:hypothetical protein
MPASLFQEASPGRGTGWGPATDALAHPRPPGGAQIAQDTLLSALPAQGLGSGALQEFLDSIDQQTEQVGPPPPPARPPNRAWTRARRLTPAAPPRRRSSWACSRRLASRRRAAAPSTPRCCPRWSRSRRWRPAPAGRRPTSPTTPRSTCEAGPVAGAVASGQSSGMRARARRSAPHALEPRTGGQARRGVAQAAAALPRAPRASEIQENVKALQAELQAAQAAADLEATLRGFRQFLENGGQLGKGNGGGRARLRAARGSRHAACLRDKRVRRAAAGTAAVDRHHAPPPAAAQASTSRPPRRWCSCARSWTTHAARAAARAGGSSSSTATTLRRRRRARPLTTPRWRSWRTRSRAARASWRRCGAAPGSCSGDMAAWEVWAL